MKTFYCDSCGSRLHFENVACLNCGATTGFIPEEQTLVALAPAGNDLWTHVGESSGRLWRKCENYAVHNVCNWMLPAENTQPFCPACALNRTIPDISEPAKRQLWGKIEAAKRRLCFTLLRLGLPLIPKSSQSAGGLAFDFLADPSPSFDEYLPENRVLTGHADGVITININEADDAVREQMRLNMREVYRTLLGHFRHESGHYYWDCLVRDTPEIEAVRAIFGDERMDYAYALKTHYAAMTNSGDSGWESEYVTHYAAAHPWEDWAETWAHYLHIIDTLETAAEQGLSVGLGKEQRWISSPFNRPFEPVLADWHALRILLNSLNRSMGLTDAYPFVISPVIAEKLAFIHQLLISRSSG